MSIVIFQTLPCLERDAIMSELSKLGIASTCRDLFITRTSRTKACIKRACEMTMDTSLVLIPTVNPQKAHAMVKYAKNRQLRTIVFTPTDNIVDLYLAAENNVRNEYSISDYASATNFSEKLKIIHSCTILPVPADVMFPIQLTKRNPRDIAEEVNTQLRGL